MGRWARYATWLLLPMAVQAAPPPAVALYYGKELPHTDFRAFDIVVIEPDHAPAAAAPALPDTRFYAYVSVTEVLPSRAYYRDIPATWKLARNQDWQSEVIDQSQPEWPAFFAERVVAPLWQRGYRGFFLDTLDSYRLATTFDEQAQQQGLVRVIEALHQRFPGIQLIFNRGFELVPQLPGKVAMVAAESLYRSWNAKTQRYEEVPEASRAWLLEQLRTIQQRDGVPVLAIDYVPTHDRALARSTAQRIQEHGIIAWVTDAALSSVGVGSVEAVARRVLVLYNGDESPALNYANPHRYLQMPLNHMGYVVDYADVREPLPANVQADRYAGVVTWFSGFIPTARRKEVGQWLSARLDEAMPLAIIGDMGFVPERGLARKFGLQPATEDPRLPLRPSQQHAMMGLETAPPLPGRQTDLFQLTPAMAGQSEALLELRDQRNQPYLGGAITPWGGIALDPNVLTEIPGTDSARWVLDPFAFLQRSLRLPALPVPDATTENGRRLLFAHVDGDGFASRAELAGSPLAADVMRREIIEKYRIPHAVSVIEAETAPHGLYPELSPQLEEVARKIFQLPHVEIASHTFSHPFLWDTKVRHGVFGDKSEAAEGLHVPGYTMDLRREIVGSSQYINERLAPPDKKVRILLWSGDTAPNAEALEITERAGLLNMNGGDTSITDNVPTLTEVGPLGITKNGFLQVYAPITNENIYTSLWKGPFYGYQRVLQTFALTESPRRLKPVDIYYHTYSASKRAGLNALHKVYSWAMAQPLHPVFPSEYIYKVQDWHGMAIARDGAGWRIRGNGALRTVRLPAALGTPLPATSQGVAGWREGPEGSYVHLTGGDAWLRTATAAPPAARPSLYEANARLTAWQAEGTSVRFSLQGHAPLEFSLRDAGACQVRADGRALSPLSSSRASGPAARAYRLSHAAADIQVQCPAR